MSYANQVITEINAKLEQGIVTLEAAQEAINFINTNPFLLELDQQEFINTINSWINGQYENKYSEFVKNMTFQELLDFQDQSREQLAAANNRKFNELAAIRSLTTLGGTVLDLIRG